MVIQERAVPRPSSGLVSGFPKHFGDPASDFTDLASANKIDENTNTEIQRNKQFFIRIKSFELNSLVISNGFETGRIFAVPFLGFKMFSHYGSVQAFVASYDIKARKIERV